MMASGYLRGAVLGVVLGLLSAAPALAESDSDKIRLIEDEAAGWSRNMDRLLASYTDDVSYEDPGLSLTLKGKEQVRGFAQSFFDAFPDLRAVITSTIVSGDRAASEWRFTGTQLGDLPGIPASNKKMDVLGASIYEFEGGKIKRKVDYWDFATALRQLGVLPAQK
jgi:steroid delta-isomerase-like uncharacterized protein